MTPNNSPEKLIEIAKSFFPSPILLLTSSDNAHLWEMSECSKPLPPSKGAWRQYGHLQGMKFRGPGWEIHLQEVENEIHQYFHDFDFDHEEQGVAAWDRKGGGGWCRT